MKRFNRIKVLVFSILYLSALSGCSSDNKVEMPNVILIMTDDQGYGDLACHGNPYIETPNLDDLHSEAIRFTNFHVNPFCAPTRAALMTGRFSDLTHVRSTIYGRNHLNTDETTMAEYYKASGYATGHFGKWHLGRNYPYRPIDRGFDQWVGHGDGGTGTSSDYWGNDKMNDTYIRNGKWEKFEGFCTDIYFDETINFIENNKDKPFFVYLATNVPHGPWNVLNDWRGIYAESLSEYESDKGGSVIDFYATITHFDRNLGRLRNYLKQNDLAENTILVYLTDNGTSGGDIIFNAEMKGKKGSVYEGGHRVPCFFHWPAEKLNTGKDIDVMTSHIDILPTMIDLCNLKIPEKVKFELSGKSWRSILYGRPADWEDRVLFLHSQNRTQEHEKWKNSLVATEEWRLVNQNELYNIMSDPGQGEDLSNKFPEKLKELQQLYEQYWIKIGEGKSPVPRTVIGSGKIDYTWLTCDAWVPEIPDPETWNQSHVMNAAMNFGCWPVTISEKGTYRLEVRRWPREADCAIRAAPEAQKAGDIFSRNEPVLTRAGKSIPAVKIKLRIGDKYFLRELNGDDTQVVFNADLEKGDTEIQGWLIDSLGNEYPAYYVYINE